MVQGMQSRHLRCVIHIALRPAETQRHYRRRDEQNSKRNSKQLLTKVRSFIVTSEEAQHREGLLLPLGYPLIAQIAQVAGAIHVRVRAITTIRTNKPMFAALA